MEFIKAMEIRKRMCKKYNSEPLYCVTCPLSGVDNGKHVGCTEHIFLYPSETEQILKKWDEERPQKTFLSDFKEKFPNAPFDEDGTPTNVCPHYLGYVARRDDNCIRDEKKRNNCVKYWSRPLEENDE